MKVLSFVFVLILGTAAAGVPKPDISVSVACGERDLRRSRRRRLTCVLTSVVRSCMMPCIWVVRAPTFPPTDRLERRGRYQDRSPRRRDASRQVAERGDVGGRVRCAGERTRKRATEILCLKDEPVHASIGGDGCPLETLVSSLSPETAPPPPHAYPRSAATPFFAVHV